jgi:hypothetical protein
LIISIKLVVFSTGFILFSGFIYISQKIPYESLARAFLASTTT